MNFQKGFSLLEVLVSLSIFSMILFGFAESISKAYLQVLKIHLQIEKKYHAA